MQRALFLILTMIVASEFGLAQANLGPLVRDTTYLVTLIPGTTNYDKAPVSRNEEAGVYVGKGNLDKENRPCFQWNLPDSLVSDHIVISSTRLRIKFQFKGVGFDTMKISELTVNANSASAQTLYQTPENISTRKFTGRIVSNAFDSVFSSTSGFTTWIKDAIVRNMLTLSFWQSEYFPSYSTIDVDSVLLTISSVNADVTMDQKYEGGCQNIGAWNANLDSGLSDFILV